MSKRNCVTLLLIVTPCSHRPAEKRYEENLERSLGNEDKITTNEVETRKSQVLRLSEDVV